MYIFDTHAHYEDKAFDEDREEVLNRIRECRVDRVVNVGSSIKTSIQTIELTKRYDFIYGAAGIHPECVMELEDEAAYTKLEECLWQEKIVALGEIGLDYHYEDNPNREIQKKHFKRQLELAEKAGLPVIIHSRDAAKDTLDILKASNIKEQGGIIHCFSYGKEMAREFLNLGFYIGIGGALTFKNARKLREVVEYMPLDRIVIETDCPYMSPEPERGKRNHSGKLGFVIKVIADIRGISEEEVVNQTCHNGNLVYKLEVHD